ncbi:MAG: response regulator receiver protein [Thermoleophilia bacterium]|nr:response regulator receiver protein [Thermoleophilia bacterium]
MARVLVVDDAMFIRHIISDLLTQHGHEVVGEACNGIEAVERFCELRPDVTTLDIVMPEKDGIAALREIMSEDPDAKVIMCSALKEKPMVLAALQAGACDYIIKPVKPERILEAVAKVLV